jgi:hypothetical protein
MTKDELSNMLHHLDPGANLMLEAADLAKVFGAEALTPEVVRAIEAFALEHRCTFVHDSAGGHPPTFDKDDVF